MPEAVAVGGGAAGCLSGMHGLCMLTAIVVCLSFGWGDVTERLKQSVIVEPIDRFERGGSTA